MAESQEHPDLARRVLTVDDGAAVRRGLSALARSVREPRIVPIESGADLIAGARSAAFAPVTSEEGTPLGARALFCRRRGSLRPPEPRRLRTTAIGGDAVLARAR